MHAYCITLFIDNCSFALFLTGSPTGIRILGYKQKELNESAPGTLISLGIGFKVVEIGYGRCQNSMQPLACCRVDLLQRFYYDSISTLGAHPTLHLRNHSTSFAPFVGPGFIQKGLRTLPRLLCNREREALRAHPSAPSLPHPARCRSDDAATKDRLPPLRGRHEVGRIP